MAGTRAAGILAFSTIALAAFGFIWAILRAPITTVIDYYTALCPESPVPLILDLTYTYSPLVAAVALLVFAIVESQSLQED